jgi:hypothetical protein
MPRAPRPPPPAARPVTAGRAAIVHDPDTHGRPYPRRRDEELAFDPTAVPAGLPVMPDTTFYIHRLQRRAPAAVLDFVDERPVFHSAVALSEISITAGLLDPAHPDTARNRAALMSLLDAISLPDCRAPSPAAWAEAGMLSGILGRTQLGLARPKGGLSAAEACCQRGERRRLLNDALALLTAVEQDAVLVSSNIADMDLLLRFRPDARVLLYRQTTRAP